MREIHPDWAHVALFLQNAWSPVYAGGRWPRSSWIVALKRSRSGQRLRHLVGDPECCHNTTPIVGATPRSVVSPDEGHVQGVLEDREPTIVVACGLQAERVLTRLWDGHLVCVPHPAARVLTNALYQQARELVEGGEPGRIALRQRRGRVEIEQLPGATSP